MTTQEYERRGKIFRIALKAVQGELLATMKRSLSGETISPATLEDLVAQNKALEEEFAELHAEFAKHVRCLQFGPAQ